MLDSLEIDSLLISLGFRLVENKTHALGYQHAALGDQRLYLKDARSKLSERRKAVRKQPLVLHPFVLQRSAFHTTRVDALSPNRAYKNSNLGAFPRGIGVAVDVPDVDALREIVELLGVPAALPDIQQSVAQRNAKTAEAKPPAVVRPSLPTSVKNPDAAPKPLQHAGFSAAAPIRFADHCCQGNGNLDAGPFTLDDLTIATEGRRRLRFAPLGNRPLAPRLALVGITPGGQVEHFASLLANHDVATAARQAAFFGKQREIKQLLAAHHFAERVGVLLDGDLNDSPDVLTTSVVKCCLMVDEGYKFAAPDIAASAAATRCATERLVGELRSYPTLRWVVIFGRPAWDALRELQVAGQRIIDLLRADGLRVVQFPHFAQNFQQRELFTCSDAAEERLLQQKPDYVKFASGAKAMRDALLQELTQT